MVYGIDISAYQKWYKLNFKEMSDNGIGFVIIKGGQGDYTKDLWNRAVAGNIPVMSLYFWEDPTLSLSYKMSMIKSDIDKYNPDFISLDVEQWWSNWQQYFDAIDGKIPWASVAIMPPDKIASSAFLVMEEIKKLYPKKKVVLYTGEWFVRAYAQPMNSWINKNPLWLANYKVTLKRAYTYAEINSLPNPTYTPLQIANKNNANANLKYLYDTFSADSYEFWQFSSAIIFPGEVYNLDTNIFNGTLEELKTWCCLTPPVIPPVTKTIEERLSNIEAWAKTQGYVEP
jgi:GH25 family lysozyme M1 (1,4-beta-N-acetylmuramidase)